MARRQRRSGRLRTPRRTSCRRGKGRAFRCRLSSEILHEGGDAVDIVPKELMEDCRLRGPVGVDRAVVLRAEHPAALARKAAVGRLERDARDIVERVQVPRLTADRTVNVHSVAPSSVLRKARSPAGDSRWGSHLLTADGGALPADQDCWTATLAHYGSRGIVLRGARVSRLLDRTRICRLYPMATSSSLTTVSRSGCNVGCSSSVRSRLPSL